MVAPNYERKAATPEQLVEIVYGLKGYFLSIASSRGYADIAQDLMQETYLKLHGMLASGRPVFLDKAREFAKTTFRNACTDLYRREKKNALQLKEIALSRRDGEKTQLARLVAEEEVDLLRAALSELPARHYQTILLRMEGLLFDQIGQIQGRTASAIKVRTKIASQKLKAKLAYLMVED